MQQRYYDPIIGRFYSNDPVWFTASNPMMFNRYAYANNNPYKFVDPDGKFPTALAKYTEKKELEIRDKHWSRNDNNKTHQTESEAKASELGFKQLPKSQSIFHMQGKGGENNKKYVSEDGHNEAVYDDRGELVTDDVNQGTYNFAPPTDTIGHGLLDVVPYVLYGNTPDDPTTMAERLTASYDGEVNVKKD